MKTKDITPAQYAEWWNKSVQYVHRLLLAEQLDKLPHVISVKKYSRFYTLQVPQNLTADSFIVIKPNNATKMQK